MRNKRKNDSDVVVIKKYSNRRLYDSAKKKYITLEDISDLIKSGKEIQVIDTQTKEDITKLILIQTILENEKNKEDILPASFLHSIIKYGNQIAKEYFDNSFIMMMQPYISFQKNLQKNMNKMGLQNPFSPFNFDQNPENISNSDSKDNSESSDLKNLHQKMEELERKIRDLSK
jgi:polyhydroxyalkanoate synthesis repressor PhaR